MDISSISAAAVMMQGAQAQQAMGTTLIKMAADQQSQMANMLAQSAQNAAAAVPESGYGLSIYA